ncbi:MarR family winged helix-turn-helix transcriptional regulator [Rudaeicoccus suwonensis]|uniref:DNA-binding MarR family transcriptional regulator n=1 Tax=Rudaeicoccus suwonensis TaxID=657409 RepID=A0A561E7U0_9MICO|nr:MarR family transcriptional regulator [Rudaeicoccus suwonensis]TWE11684.1 DNA-binding MarR family transcriptional regulator [Rudaeicoccus suwonensis]
MTPDERRTLAADLRAVCMRISRRSRFDNATEIAPHQFSVLAKIEDGVTTPGRLAQIECVSAPSMTRTVGDLVERGLVARVADTDDRRVVQLSTTPAGRSMLRKARGQRDAWMLERLKGLSEEECAVLVEASQILGRVVAR